MRSPDPILELLVPPYVWTPDAPDASIIMSGNWLELKIVDYHKRIYRTFIALFSMKIDRAQKKNPALYAQTLTLFIAQFEAVKSV